MEQMDMGLMDMGHMGPYCIDFTTMVKPCNLQVSGYGTFGYGTHGYGTFGYGTHGYGTREYGTFGYGACGTLLYRLYEYGKAMKLTGEWHGEVDAELTDFSFSSGNSTDDIRALRAVSKRRL